MKRSNLALIGLVMSGSLLTSCGDGSPEQVAGKSLLTQGLSAQSLVAASGGAFRTYQADLQSTTITRLAGLADQVAQTAPGLKSAFLFVNGQVKTRIDYPGSSFFSRVQKQQGAG